MNLWSILSPRSSKYITEKQKFPKKLCEIQTDKNPPFVTDYAGNDTYKMFEHFS